MKSLKKPLGVLSLALVCLLVVPMASATRLGDLSALQIWNVGQASMFATILQEAEQPSALAPVNPHKPSSFPISIAVLIGLGLISVVIGVVLRGLSKPEAELRIDAPILAKSIPDSAAP